MLLEIFGVVICFAAVVCIAQQSQEHQTQIDLEYELDNND